MTFEAAVRSFAQTHNGKWKSHKSRQSVIGPLERFALPVLGQLPVQSIDVTLVMQVLEPIWQTRTVTAGRLRGALEQVLAWAVARNLRSDNPAAWSVIGQILPPPRRLRKVQHLASMAYVEMPAFMVELRAVSGISARALELAILTAARTAEVLAARWSEIDLPNAVWVVPANRMKNAKPHRVPLSPAAVRLLEQLPRVAGSEEYVFPGQSAGSHLSSNSMLAVLRRLNRAVTVHGMRACFRTWAAEQTNFPREICEAAMSHAAGSAVELSYQRSDQFVKRRKLMEAWATFCGRPSTSAEVVTLRPAS